MEEIGVRRRMVQSTLFPHKDSSVKEAENCGSIQIEAENGNKEVVAQEEEECGGGGKRRKTKRKPNFETKTTPPTSSTKVKNISLENSSKQVDFDDSPITTKSSFFVKTSERGQNKKQRNQPVHVDSPEKNDELCSPSNSVANGKSTPQKSKRQHNSTPKKENMNSTPSKKTKNGSRKLCSTQMSFDLILDEQQLPTIPNLRLEAKLTAEGDNETSRIFAGKQVHPFFTSWKPGKNDQELTGSDSKWPFFEKKEKGIIFNPIHVFENVEEDHMKLDWGHWRFPETSVSDTLDYQCSPVYERSVKSLNFDNYWSGSCFTRTSLHPNSHQSSIQLKEVSICSLDQRESLHPITFSTLADNRVLCDAHLKDVDMLQYNKEEICASSVQITVDHTNESNDFFAGNSSLGNLDSKLQERIMSNNNTSHNQLENCLWTDKYRPQNSKQICGNGQSVNFLSEWLQRWQKKGSPESRICIDEDTGLTEDDGFYCLQSNCDSDSTDGDDNLKNVLLVTGPVGSGKSAAIYACAREHGFQIIEINASDWRNGALVRQKFGEAVESHWLQRTSGNPINSDKSLSKFFSPVNTKTHCPDMDVLGTTPLDKEDSQNADALSKKIISEENLTDNCQNGIKTLILFEDVDANLCEDHGFISTIQQLAETAKRPMILTSNSNNPVLPKNLDRSELSFLLPSLRDLLGNVGLICAAENIKIYPFLVERFVDHCQGDIRKTIMLLQFWCCGLNTKRGNKLHTTYNPIPFDLDAGHHILPKMIPWEYPSRLSEFVFKEVNNFLVLTEEIPIKGEELNDNIAENVCRQNDELDPFAAKKEVMLSLHRLHQDEAEYTTLDANLELYDSSCSPTAFRQQRRQRKTNTVLSSDSEDELLGGCTQLDLGGLLDVDVKVLASHCLTTQIGHLPTELIHSSAVDELEEHRFQPSEAVSYTCMDYICNSLNTSCVPESSFVPETELIKDTDLYSTTVSYDHFANATATATNSFVQDSLPVMEPTVGANYELLHVTLTYQEMFGNHSETGVAFAYQEEVGESQSKCEADVPRDYQVLDECSCVDFANGLKSFDNQHKTDNLFNSVQESWNRMRCQCKDLRNYVTTEEKSYFQSLKFAHGITDIISNTDLLLNNCHTLLIDSLEPSMDPCEKTHSYSFHDDQSEMSSVLAQHGMCFYAKEIMSLGSITGSAISLDLATEMLSSSVSSIALGKLASLERNRVEVSDTKPPKSSDPLTCKSNPHICNIFKSVVPSRSYLAVRGEPFHEYLSTLSQISRFETSRLSESVGNNKRRRARVPCHYLSSGSSTMSSEEIYFLEQYNAYKMDASFGHKKFR